MTDESVFAQALAIGSPAERAAYLDRACAGNPALRAEVQALLDAHAASNPLDQPPVDVARTGAYEPARGADEAVGTVIAGKYKLVELIGAGGMGAVYMAQQTEPVKRLVAVKVIRDGMDTRQVLARFEAERQALALMDHPNIAKVLDAGTTDRGRPFFVMELVKGVPITEFCDARKLSPRERLELFVPVCQAIQHAHQKGVIHRDIKPSNVLVALYDGKPVPKVIDFGVAKAAGQPLTDKTLVTGFGAIVGTPEYMSPEQAELNQLDIDTRSDVFALGVLLYELLTGSTPLNRTQLGKAALLEVLRIVREVEPPKPSTRVSTSDARASIAANRNTDPARLSKLMKGELDWIVMKALEKDRNRRYDSATALAKDVERHLSGDAVEACPPTLGYRLRKAYKRNRAAVLTGFTIALTLLAGVCASVAFAWQADRARRGEIDQRSLAEVRRLAAIAERDKAKEANAELARVSAEQRAEQYAVTLTTLPVAWNAGNVIEARRLLDRLRPAPGEADLRNFEWRYWDRHMHAELSTTQLSVQPLASDRLGRMGWTDPTTNRVWVISPDGGRAAVLLHTVSVANPATKVMLVQVWDIQSRKRLLAHEIPDDAHRDGSANATCDLRFSHDGKRLAVEANAWVEARAPGERSQVRYRQQALDVDSGKILVERTSDNAAGSLTIIDMSADGRFCLLTQPAADTRLSTEVFDLDAGGKQVAKLAHSQIVRFTPDGSRVFERSGNAKVWDSATGRELQTLDAGQELRYWIFSTDGTRVFGVVTPLGAGAKAAVVGVPQVVVVLDAATGKKLPDISLPEDKSGAATLTFAAIRPNATPLSADGSRLWLHRRKPGITGKVEVIVIDAKQGRTLFTLETPSMDGIGGGDAGAARFSPDGKLFVLPNHTDFSIAVHDATTGRVIRTLRGHTRPIERFTFCGDGRRLASVEADGTLKEWQLVPDSPVRIDVGARFNTQGVGVSGDGQRLVTAPRDADGPAASLGVWQASGKLVREITLRPRMNLPKDDRNRLAPVLNRDGTRVALVRPAVGPDGKLTAEGDLAVWDVASGIELFYAKGRFSTHPAAISAAGDLVAVLHVTEDRTVTTLVFDVATGRKRAISHRPGEWIAGSLHFRPDGKRLAGFRQPLPVPRGGGELLWRTLIVWDVADGKELSGFTEQPLAGSAQPTLAWSPDGNRIVVPHVGRTGSVTVHNAETGEVEAELNTASCAGRGTSATLPTYNPDGRRIAGVVETAQGRSIKVWDAATGRELLELRATEAGEDFPNRFLAHFVNFSADGNQLLEYAVKFRENPFVGFGPGAGGFPKRPTIPVGIDITLWDATPRPEPPK